MKHLILVGACYLDTILTVPHFPAEDAKQRATALQVRRGGNCPNSLEVLAQLVAADRAQLVSSVIGPQQQQQFEAAADDDNTNLTNLKLHLVSCLPAANSVATRNILSSFNSSSSSSSSESDSDPASDTETNAREGGSKETNNDKRKEQRPSATINFNHCLYRPNHDAPASSYIIRSAATGSRTIVNFNDLPEMTVREFEAIAAAFVAERDESAGGDGDGCWWHFEGRIPETTLRCIRHLRQALPRSTVSVEVEKPGRDGLAALAAEADVVFYSRSWAEDRGYASPEECLRSEAPSSKASLMLCTWGEQGAGLLTPASGEYLHHAPANSPDGTPLVDTIGAGDTFVAGMLFGMHVDAWSAEARLTFAVELATKKVQREGFAGLVTQRA